MLRKVFAASVVLVLSVGFVLADELRGIITKVEGNKVTFTEFKGKGQKGDEQTFTAVKGVKVVKGVRNKDDRKKVDAGDEIEGGLKNKMFSESDKGVFALIVTGDDKKIKEIRVLTKGKGKGKQ
jgi:hypothetical protein